MGGFTLPCEIQRRLCRSIPAYKLCKSTRQQVIDKFTIRPMEQHIIAKCSKCLHSDDLATDQWLHQWRSAGFVTIFQSDAASAHRRPTLVSDSDTFLHDFTHPVITRLRSEMLCEHTEHLLWCVAHCCVIAVSRLSATCLDF